ncbi:hypothetical protein IHE61_21915 [Streptomyces sp. GKU 257-1]|nr:hypothetical protein [Streptomyces sp. GKU 257-1]
MLGLGWEYGWLTDAAPGDQPLYALRPRGMDTGTAELPDSLSRMAADYVEQIRTVQPTGPLPPAGLVLRRQRRPGDGGPAPGRGRRGGRPRPAGLQSRGRPRHRRAAGGLRRTGGEGGRRTHRRGARGVSARRPQQHPHPARPPHPEDHRHPAARLSADSETKAARWRHFVSGEVREHVLDCAHRDMLLNPDVVRRIWDITAGELEPTDTGIDTDPDRA